MPIGYFWRVPENLSVVRWQGGELLAWRVWNLCRWRPDGSLRLVSATRPTVWDGPVLMADHRPLATPSCGSGVYAVKPSVRPCRRHYDWALGGETWVRGWVALSGQVVEHERGYRAERAVIRRLRLGAAAHRYFRSPKKLARVREELERRYQCPVKISGVDMRIARGFASPVSLRTIGEVRTPAAIQRAGVPHAVLVSASGPTPKLYGRAVRRFREYLANLRIRGKQVMVDQRPYYAGLSHVRAVIRVDGMLRRVFFQARWDRWRRA